MRGCENSPRAGFALNRCYVNPEIPLRTRLQKYDSRYTVPQLSYKKQILNSMEHARKVGRPLGSGKQLPNRERAEHSRQERAAAGSTRVDVTLDNITMAALAILVEHWECRSKKDAVARAIRIAAGAISKNEP